MTRAQYQEALANLKEIHATHPLMSRLERGFSTMNVRYMQKALDGLYKDSIKPKDDDPVLRSMWVAISKKLAREAILANQFKGMNTDEDRKENSIRIKALRTEIADDFLRVDTYRATGTLPPEAVDDRNTADLPSEPAALLRKIHSLRTMLGQVKRELEALASQPKADRNGERIKVLEKRIKTLQNTLARAKRKYEG